MLGPIAREQVGLQRVGLPRNNQLTFRCSLFLVYVYSQNNKFLSSLVPNRVLIELWVQTDQGQSGALAVN